MRGTSSLAGRELCVEVRDKKRFWWGDPREVDWVGARVGALDARQVKNGISVEDYGMMYLS